MYYKIERIKNYINFIDKHKSQYDIKNRLLYGIWKLQQWKYNILRNEKINYILSVIT